MKEVVERVGPQQHPAPAAVGRRRRLALGEPVPERDRGERRHLPLGGDSGQPLAQTGEGTALGQQVGEPRGPCRQFCLPADQTQRVGLARTQAAGVVMREELGLVGRHVDPDRALVQAPLAGKAEIEGLLDLLVAPPALER